MENFQPNSMATVIKPDNKKDLLLSSKDPHLSHLFGEHGGPPPHSLPADNISQSNIDVEGNYPEESNEQEYSLFPEQGASFMPGFHSESSQLVMDVSCATTSGTARSRCGTSDENNNCREKAKMPMIATHRLASSMKKNEISQPMRPPNLMINSKNVENKSRDEKPQLLSPPADHYNMQLLAHSAQQQQQLLQQQRQQQQEMFGQGSSSAALQHLAKLHQQGEQGIEMIQDYSTFAAKSGAYTIYSHGDTIKTDATGKSIQMPLSNTINPSNVDQMPYSSSMQASSKQPPALISNYQTWPSGERVISEFEKGHVRDLSFGSQDSPIFSLPMGEIAKNPVMTKTTTSLLYHKHSAAALPSAPANEPEPELKSPLDHPDQLERHRSRFFSTDSGAASGGEQQPEDDDEAPLNEHDKKAAAAISQLMEQGEKNPPVAPGIALSYKPNTGITEQNFVRPTNASQGLSLSLLQVQELFRNTPPPTYEQSLLPGTAGTLAIPPAVVAQIPQSTAMAMSNNEIKQEPNSPATKVPPRQYYIPSQNCVPLAMQEDPSKYSGNNVEMSPRVGNTALASSLTSTAPYPQLQPTSSVNPETAASHLPSKPTPSQSGRARKTSSSSSTRRKSDGNLTCGLCGHSFRSTPALNGHMRVHSTPDKKQNKEERHSRSTSSENTAKASPLIKPAISPQIQSYYEGGKLQTTIPLPQDANVNPDGNVRIYHPYQYPAESLDPSLQNRPHNGLLTMASAACFLKTEASKADYPNAVLPSAYAIVPHPVLLQQPAVVPSSYHVDVLNPSFNENQPTANPFQQAGLPFGLFTNMPQVAQPIIPPDGSYPNNQLPVQMLPSAERDMNINSQNYSSQPDKPMGMVSQDENYSSQYAVPANPETNSLSQLATIAVAAASREYDPNPELPVEISANYPANEMQPANAEPGSAENVGLISNAIGSGGQQECLSQEEVFQPANITTETSPLQSGHDPFIFPVSAPNQSQQRPQYNEYNSMSSNIPGGREPMVTWKDNVDTRSYPLLSSYDDSLMQEAVNVANPSKILPNSMMGGTPTAGSILSGARPFRQRHHSEGAHLIKNRENSILKRILDNPVAGDIPVVNEKLSDCAAQEIINSQPPPDVLMAADVYPTNTLDKNTQQASANVSETKKVEFWAEPKPIQRKIRRRRHSADSRLFLKPGPLPSRLVHHNGNQAKKTTSLRKDRARRPPPLVIPSSVNTYTPGQNIHHLYQSHLHHRRRPSGESSSSATALNDKIPPYTPPPMLSPIRAGSGLYCTTPVTPMFNRQKSMDGGIPTILEVDETGEEDEELIRSSEPKINIGPRFQASIPKIRSRSTISSCPHNADKIWSPKTTEEKDRVHKHIEQFMELSCSAVVPFGGSNKEFALDCIAQSNGDILDAVRRLITRKEDGVVTNKKVKNYTGAGVPWTTEETKQFECAMLQHRKDFFVISKMVQSRTTAECVERYYHVVKRNRRQSRVPRRYRDQETDQFATLLADSLREKSSPSSQSSSDEEITSKSKISSDTDLGSWLPPGDLPNKHEHLSSYSSHSSPSSVSAHQFQKPIKTHAARVQHGRIETPSPVGSPVSNISNDDQPSQVFTCPVCGKSFAKVKSRNAHMKTHGKQAQEKRRQREEAAARRREELANRQQLSSGHRPVGAPLAHPNFIHPPSVSAGKLFPHPPHHHLQQTLPDGVIPRYSSGM